MEVYQSEYVIKTLMELTKSLTLSSKSELEVAATTLIDKCLANQSLASFFDSFCREAIDEWRRLSFSLVSSGVQSGTLPKLK